MAMERSARGLTVVAWEAELLVVSGSASAALMRAVLVMVPPAVALTLAVMVISGAAPTARTERVEVTVPPAWLMVHPFPLAETKATPSGRVSVTITEEALLGPALLTRRV